MPQPFVERLNGVVDPAEQEQVIAVVRAIQRTVEPQTWDVAGGTGSIVAVRPPSNVWHLVIKNDDATVEGKIETLLTALGRT